MAQMAQMALSNGKVPIVPKVPEQIFNNPKPTMAQQLQIRNSTAEFLIFQAEDKAQGVQVFYQDENIWATQIQLA